MTPEEWDELQAQRARDSVIFAAGLIRSQHDPVDWPSLHAGPITYERAVSILEWWHGRYVHGSSLDIHRPPSPSHGGPA